MRETESNAQLPLASEELPIAGQPLLLAAHDSATDAFHRALVASKSWGACAFAGIQPGPHQQYFELRHCPMCFSTLCKSVDHLQALSILADQRSLLKRTFRVMK